VLTLGWLEGKTDKDTVKSKEKLPGQSQAFVETAEGKLDESDASESDGYVEYKSNADYRSAPIGR